MGARASLRIPLHVLKGLTYYSQRAVVARDVDIFSGGNRSRALPRVFGSATAHFLKRFVVALERTFSSSHSCTVRVVEGAAIVHLGVLIRARSTVLLSLLAFPPEADRHRRAPKFQLSFL